MPKRKTFLMTCAGCAGLMVLTIGSCAGLLYYGYLTTDSTVSPKIDAMFSAIDNQTFGDTYETETSDELRSTVTKEQYARIGEGIRVRLGKLESKSLQNVKMKQFNADSYVSVSYAATFENGPGTITARLKKEGDDWKFVSFRVNSPLFDQDFVTVECPTCGEPCTAEAKFCPACGGTLTSEADEAPSDDEAAPDQPPASASATEPSGEPDSE